MIKIKEFAKTLNGRQYRKEITHDEEIFAIENRLVVIFGYSDDNMEIRGAVNDEIGCFEGGEVLFTENGILENLCENDCPYFEREKEKSMRVSALYDCEGYMWIYQTDIPHEIFDIYRGERKYCRGIIFSLNDVKSPLI